MEILLSWKRKRKQWRGFIRELKRHGIDFYDRNQPDFGTRAAVLPRRVHLVIGLVAAVDRRRADAAVVGRLGGAPCSRAATSPLSGMWCI